MKNFFVNFSNFMIDLEPNKHLSHVFNLSLLKWQNKTPRLKIENKNKENIKNLFNFNQRLGPRFFIRKKSIYHLSPQFDRPSF